MKHRRRLSAARVAHKVRAHSSRVGGLRQLRVLGLFLLGRLAFELPSKAGGNPVVCIVALVVVMVTIVYVHRDSVEVRTRARRPR